MNRNNMWGGEQPFLFPEPIGRPLVLVRFVTSWVFDGVVILAADSVSASAMTVSSS